MILVNNRQDWNIVVQALVGGNDAMIIVDDLLEVANSNWRPSKLVNFESLLFFILILRLKQLLILDELLLHQQIVFDSVLSE